MYRKSVNYTHFKKKRSLSSLSELSCCGKEKSISRKDVVVINPQKIHYAKKIIVGKQFRKLLKALYRDHPKASQAINGKFQLSESNGEDRTEAGKNRTLKELRSAILTLLAKLKKRANSSQSSELKAGKQEVLPKVVEGNYSRNNSSKTVQKKIQEHGGDTGITSPNKIENENENEISAKRANYLDLLNFITEMKTMEGIRDTDTFHQQMMHGLKGMQMNGLNGIPNARNLLSGSFSSPMNAAYNPGELLPGNTAQMQDMNPEQQRKVIDDQMENHLAQLQANSKSIEQQQQQLVNPNFYNDQMSNAAPGLEYPIATPEVSNTPLGLAATPFLNPAQPPLYEAAPYLPFRRPHQTFRTHLPFPRPIDPAPAYPVHDEDPGEEIDDGEVDDDRDGDEPPRHYHMPEEDEPEDNENDEEGQFGPYDDEK